MNTVINGDITNLKDLVSGLRNCVAHFSIEVRSQSDAHPVDDIIFYDHIKSPGYEVANFSAPELLPFVRYYASWLLSNLKLKEIYA